MVIKYRSSRSKVFCKKEISQNLLAGLGLGTLRFKIVNNPIDIQYWPPLKILIMENDSGYRSNQVQDGENNGSREKSPIPVNLERQRNAEKDSLVNRKQES